MDKNVISDGSPLLGSALNELSDEQSNVAQSTGHRSIGYVALFWGLGGVVALLSLAILRLFAISIDAFGFSLTLTHWVVFVLSVILMAYAEGYRTFQKSWAPRVVQRAFQLQHQWTPITLLLAPFYCMSFFQATRKRCITAWVTTVCIVLLVIVMNRMAQPWRGLIDAGVVVGLSWGVAALLLQTFSKFSNKS